MSKVAELNSSVPNYDADNAGELARQYQENFQKPGNALAMEAAHRKVDSDSYRPSDERNMSEIQTALAAYQRDNKLDPTGFGDHATLKALGIAPALDATSSASLQRMVDDRPHGQRRRPAVTRCQRDLSARASSA